MGNRITLITLFDSEQINKINALMSKINRKTCKVPYGINDEKRYEIDNLPYHFTIFATNKNNQKELLELAEILNINKIKVKVNDIKIMNARYDSYCLYLSIVENNQIKELQRLFHNKFPKEAYNPDNFIFHITLHIDKDYSTVLGLQKVLKENFESFSLEFDKLALYDYPGDMIKKMSTKNSNN